MLNRIYDKVMGGVEAAGGIKAKLFKQAFEAKKYWLARNDNKYKIWDSLVFDKVRRARCPSVATSVAVPRSS